MKETDANELERPAVTTDGVCTLNCTLGESLCMHAVAHVK